MFGWIEPGPVQVAADFTSLSSFTAEASLLAGVAKQPVVPRGFFDRVGRKFKLRAWGVFSTTGTPTYQFAGRLGSTVGVATLTGALVGQSAALVTASGAANAPWIFDLTLTCRIPGQGANGTTLSCAGTVRSPGFASPFEYILVPTTGTPQTWTQTIDNSVDNFFNLSAVCSASSASNVITCKELEWVYW